MANDIDDFEIPNHGYLAGWAQQGNIIFISSIMEVKCALFNNSKVSYL